jgi:hypothetical protein
VKLCPLSCVLMLQIWSPTFSSTSPCALGACSTEIKNKFHTDKSINLKFLSKLWNCTPVALPKIITKAKQSWTLLVAPSLHLLDKIMEIVHRVQPQKLPFTHIIFLRIQAQHFNSRSELLYNIKWKLGHRWEGK